MKTTILIERNYEGSLIASAIVEGHRIHRIYQGYTKRYVKTDFRKYLNSLSHAN